MSIGELDSDNLLFTEMDDFLFQNKKIPKDTFNIVLFRLDMSKKY